MKWGRRKSSSPSSSSSSSSKPSFISHVSPLSWLSKFKNMRINSHPLSATMKQKGTTNQNSLSVISPPQCKSCENGGRFYGGDDDDEAFWRLSFGEESKEDKKSKDILSNAKKYERRREGTSKLKENNKRELGDERNSPNGMKMDEYNNREKELDKLRRRFERKSQRVLQERVLRLEREAENATPTPIWTPRNHSFQKTEEFKANTEKKRQSILVSREIQRRKPKQSSKVRIYSPRMSSKAEICKIKALEEMRKAKLKMKKAKEGLDDSFAVVKCSLDPQKDFRDSMVEMIREKQIGQAEEMEELLASYLTLNSEEYHDLIIKVFKQVWFDMNIVWGFS